MTPGPDPASADPLAPARGPLRAEVLAIGDELTSGQRLDTNSQWLAQRLADLGVAVVRHATIGDDLAANIAEFSAAARRSDVVVATGVLGPTDDDLTREAIAEAAGVELVIDAGSLTHIEQMFLRRGRTMPPQNRRQAALPRGARVVPNAGGTAPGVDLAWPGGGARVFALPGVPAEMRQMWAETVAPAIAAMSPTPLVLRHYLLKCFGAGESHVESLVPGMIARGREPRVGITASKGTISLRITSSGPDNAACLERMAGTIAEARAALAEFLFAEGMQGEPAREAPALAHDAPTLIDDWDIEHAACAQLAERGQSVATVEAWTAGLAARKLGLVDPASRCFVGGEINRPPQSTIAEEWARGAAQRVRLARGADWGLAIGPLEQGSRVDRSAVAVASASGIVSRVAPVVGHPSIHHEWAAKAALALLRQAILAPASLH